MHSLYNQRLARALTAAIFLLVFPLCLSAQRTVDGVLRIKVSEPLATRLEQARTAGDPVTGVESIDRMSRQFRVKKFTRVFPHAGKYEARHRKHGLHLWYEVRMDKSIPVTSAIQSYQSDQQILRAEPVFQKAIIGSTTSAFGPRVIKDVASVSRSLPNAPDDPLLSSQWHYHNTGQSGGAAGADIHLFEAWKTETGSNNVIVAVTDGGIQADHPDLAANMWVNEGEIAGNDIDDDNNGYVDDIHGYGFVNDDNEILPHDHGTHVAGTLAAVNNNGIGVAGVAGGSGNGDGIRIMSCAVFAYDSIPDGFAEAYVYAADNGAVISQNSWGYTLPGVFEHVVLEAIDYFIAEAGKDASGRQSGPMNGGLALFSAGNFNDEGNYYPSYYGPVVAVASTDHQDTRAFYSNYGSWVDISAPGGETDVNEAQGVISTLTESQYGAFMGTSMACPHVSGVAALIVSHYAKPGLTPDAVRTRLLLSVDDIYSKNRDYSGKLGTGRLNAALAVRTGDASPPDPIDDLRVESIEVGKMTLTWTSPIDDGDFVSEYELRYSTAPITAENFADAIQVPDVPAPKSPGTTERFTATNLPGGIEYYFAIRSFDFQGNASPISNVISEVSALTPSMVVTPGALRANLLTASRSTSTFIVENNGEGPLKFSIHPGSDPQSFATISPLAGQLSPGKRQVISVTFDASHKREGNYQQEIIVSGNDPVNKTATVELTLHVTDNGAPIARVEPDSLNFNSVQTGQTTLRHLSVLNEGSDPLVIEGIDAEDAQFTTNTPVPLTIEPFEKSQLSIVFTPSQTGVITSQIVLSTNDPASPMLPVRVRGEGLTEAPIAVTPSYFDETLEKGSKIKRTLTLRNNGSGPREYRLESMNRRLVREADNAVGRTRSRDDEASVSRQSRITEHQDRFSEKHKTSPPETKPLSHGAQVRAAKSTARVAPAYKRDLRQYSTGFEEFAAGPVREQHGWYATQGWTISDQNPDAGTRNFRGISQVSGTGEKYCLSPYLFEYEEFYYPQYTTASMRINADNATGTSWEVVPQDPWSYVATRLRFNADRTLDAMVIGNDYDVIWKRVPGTVPQGYFDIAIEYNSAGSDTSGFPTYYLFINNQHVFSGTGLASGIGQVAFVSPMETTGPTFDVDGFSLVGGEYIPPFITMTPREGVLQPGESIPVALEFDASIMKYGTYESDLVVHLDEIDSIAIPVTVHIPGPASLWRDTYSIYMTLEKNEPGLQPVYLKNDGGETVTFDFDYDLRGLSVAPESGTLQVREEEFVEVTFDGPPGIYKDSIVIRTNISEQPDYMPVTITRYDSGAIFQAPDTVHIQAIAGEKTGHPILLENAGVNTVSYTSEVSGALKGIIALTPASATIGDEPLDAEVIIDATGLSPGIIRGTIRFQTNDPDTRRFDTHVILTVIGEAPTRYVVREVWTGVTGREVASIPLDTEPSYEEQLPSFQSPSNSGDNYGSRIRGYVQPGQSGVYRFYITSNDHSELWLSTDDSENNKRRIAWVKGFTNPDEWNKFASQQSQPVTLEANKKYYIEALHKEGVGTDHLAVGWQKPDGAFQAAIPGESLLPFEPGDGSGTIVREFWNGVRGTHVSDIPLNTPPDGSEELKVFEGPLNVGVNYGARIRGYIHPPVTGEYYFWIASNDHSELWISQDEDPSNIELAAFLTRATDYREWQRFASQKSRPIFLVKGKVYYVEVLHKQGIGSDHISVGWQLPDGSMERPIAGSRLSPFAVQPAQLAGQFPMPEESDGVIHAFPNPLTGSALSVSIEKWPAETTAAREIVIRDLSGRLVHEEVIDCAEGCETMLDVGDKLHPGVFILEVRSPHGKSFVEKLIVR